MATEASGSSTQQWLGLEGGKRTRIADATEEKSTRWLERHYCDQDGASSQDDDAFGAQPSYGPALWQVGEEYGGQKRMKIKSTQTKKNKTVVYVSADSFPQFADLKLAPLTSPIVLLF